MKINSNWATSNLADSKELQGTVQNERLTSRMEWEQGKYSRKKKWVGYWRFIFPLGDDRCLLGRLPNQCHQVIFDWFKIPFLGEAKL